MEESKVRWMFIISILQEGSEASKDMFVNSVLSFIYISSYIDFANQCF